MSEENVEVIRDSIAAMNEGEYGRAMGHLADDVVLEAPAGIRGGTFRGREAVSEWFGDWFRIFDWNVHSDIRRSPRSATTAFSWSPICEAGVAGSGVDVEETFAWLYRLREGKITRMDGYLSRSQALEAAGLRE